MDRVVIELRVPDEDAMWLRRALRWAAHRLTGPRSNAAARARASRFAAYAEQVAAQADRLRRRP